MKNLIEQASRAAFAALSPPLAQRQHSERLWGGIVDMGFTESRDVGMAAKDVRQRRRPAPHVPDQVHCAFAAALAVDCHDDATGGLFQHEASALHDRHAETVATEADGTWPNVPMAFSKRPRTR